MAMITNDWLDAIQGEFSKPYYRDLFNFVKEEYSRVVVYPPADDIFNAFHFTPLSKVKVLILGQDPYHNVHQAHGLSFSVPEDQKEIPPSLQNIYKELHDDLGCDIPNNGYSEEVGRSGGSVVKHGSDGAGTSGSIPSGERLGAVYGCCDPGSQCAGPADCLYALGQTGTKQDPDADESKASDPEGTSSKSVIGISWFLWL